MRPIPVESLLHRGLVVVAAALGLGASRLALDGWFASYFLTSVAGFGLAFGVVAVWGERTRPRFNLLWLVLLVALLGVVLALLAADAGEALPRYAAMALLVGLFIANDHVLGPTLLVGAPILLAVFPPGLDWQDATDSHAWMIAFSALFGLIAASLERDRLHARASAPIPWPWTVVRLGIVTAWTILVMMFKEELQVGSLFASLGLDPRGVLGRYALLALFIIALVAATFLFRGRKARQPAGEEAASALPEGPAHKA